MITLSGSDLTAMTRRLRPRINTALLEQSARPYAAAVPRNCSATVQYTPNASTMADNFTYKANDGHVDSTPPLSPSRSIP
jgi:hypothetical protein